MKSSKDEIYLKSSRVRNTLPGTEGTYHDTVSSLDVCDLDTFSERAGKKCGYGTAVVKNVIGAVGAEAQETLSTRLYRINAFGLTFEAAISGSVPSIDSPLTADNKVYVAIHPSSKLKYAASGITPIRTNGGSCAVIDKVEDEASGEPGVIVGVGMFIITGWALSTSGEGEGVSAKSLVNGTTATATVVRNESCQAVWARLDTALPAGKAKLCVTTLGNGIEETPLPVYKTVTIKAAEPGPEPGPEPLVLTSATSEGQETGTVSDMEATSIAGVDLPTWGLDANDIVQMRGKNQEFVCANVQQITETGNLVFNIDSQAHDVFENNDDVTFYVRISGREGTLAAKWMC